MFGRSNHGWIGLDIGASTIKLAQVDRRGDRLQIADAVVVHRRAPWRDRNMVNAAPLPAAEYIGTALIGAPGVSGRGCAAVLPTAACEFNTAPFADDEADQVAAIVEELASVNVNLADRVFDCWPGLATKAGKAGVNVVSTTRDWSDTTCADLLSAGLRCQTIDGVPQALSRAVTLATPTSSAPVAALDWGYSGATFVLIDQSQPVYVRQLKRTQFANILDVLSEQLNLEHSEVTELLRITDLNSANPAASDEVAEVINELLEPMIAALVVELERTLEHLNNVGRSSNNQRRSLAPEVIYLFGGGATIQGIDRILSRRLGRKFQVWSLPGHSDTDSVTIDVPLCMLGPAIALSALRWEAQS